VESLENIKSSAVFCSVVYRDVTFGVWTSKRIS